MDNNKTIILASASPRRKNLLEGLGMKFKIIISDIDESFCQDMDPDKAVRCLALKKAEDVLKKIDYPAIIIGADTTVVIDNQSLGKPKDFDEAFRMLSMLSGRSHKVITGIAVIDSNNTSQGPEFNKTFVDSITSEVFFKELSGQEIYNYIKTGEPMDKAGAYAIQGIGSIFISQISGCYNNIVGLPIFRLYQILEELGFSVLEKSV